MQWSAVLSAVLVLASSVGATTSADAQFIVPAVRGTEAVSHVMSERAPADETAREPTPELARLRTLARRERRLGYASGILFLIGFGTSIGAMGASWQGYEYCPDPTDLTCVSGGVGDPTPARLLAGTSIAVLSSSWATSIGAGVVGRRLAEGLQREGFDPMWPRARASMALAAIPLFGTWGLTSPWIASRHARRALEQLDGRGRSSRRHLASTRMRLRLDVGSGAGALSLVGAF